MAQLPRRKLRSHHLLERNGHFWHQVADQDSSASFAQTLYAEVYRFWIPTASKATSAFPVVGKCFNRAGNQTVGTEEKIRCAEALG